MPRRRPRSPSAPPIPGWHGIGRAASAPSTSAARRPSDRPTGRPPRPSPRSSACAASAGSVRASPARVDRPVHGSVPHTFPLTSSQLRRPIRTKSLRDPRPIHPLGEIPRPALTRHRQESRRETKMSARSTALLGLTIVLIASAATAALATLGLIDITSDTYKVLASGIITLLIAMASVYAAGGASTSNIGELVLERNLPHQDPRERNKEMFGFYYHSIVMDDELDLNGSSKSNTSFDLAVISGDVEFREHLHSPNGECQFSGGEITAKGDARNSTITLEIKRLNPQSIHLHINFTPALRIGDWCRYSIEKKFKNGGFCMTREEIAKQISAGSWMTLGLFEYLSFYVMYPTDELSVRLTFPIGYHIYGGELWDVFTGDSYQRNTGEYERLRRITPAPFDRTEVGGRAVIQLKVPAPLTGLTYALKWVPPSGQEVAALKERAA